MRSYLIRTYGKNPQHARNKVELDQRTGRRLQRKATKVSYVGKQGGWHTWRVNTEIKKKRTSGTSIMGFRMPRMY